MALSSAELGIIIAVKDQASAALKGINKEASGLGGTLSGALKVGAIAGAAGVAALAGGLVSCVKDAMEAQKVMAQTDAVIASTGGVSGMTAKSVSDLANNLAKVIPVGDEVIQSTENMLLTFTNVGKDIFPQATEAALNMSVALGTDAVGAAVQLGKALNDPIGGVTALRKVGVQLTEQQEAQIKAMVEAGDAAGAQAIILKELETEFGNSGRAAGETAAGQFTILSTQLGNVKEQIGMALLPVLLKLGTFVASDLIPAVQKLAAEWLPKIKEGFNKVKEAVQPALDKLTPFVKMLSEKKEAMIAAVAIIGVALVAAFVALGIAAASAAIGVVAATWPIIAIAAAVAGVSVVVYELVTHFDEIKKAVEGLPVIGDIVKGVVDYVKGIFDQFMKVFDDVKVVAEDLLNFFKAVFSGDWQAAWDSLKKLASDALQGLIDFVKLGFLTSIGGLLTSFIPWDSVKDAIGDFGAKFTGAFTGVKDFLTEHWPEIATIISGPFAPLVLLATDGFGVRTALVNMFTALPGQLVSALSGLGGMLTTAFKGAFNSVIGAVNSFIGFFNDLDIPGFKVSIPLAPDIVFPGFDFPNIPTIPLLAHGGIVTRPTFALLAERGPEAVIPLGQGMAAGNTYNTFNIDVGRDGVFLGDQRERRAIVDAILPEIKKRVG
jgi:hypothetical protein